MTDMTFSCAADSLHGDPSRADVRDVIGRKTGAVAERPPAGFVSSDAGETDIDTSAYPKMFGGMGRAVACMRSDADQHPCKRTTGAPRPRTFRCRGRSPGLRVVVPVRSSQRQLGASDRSSTVTRRSKRSSATRGTKRGRESAITRSRRPHVHHVGDAFQPQVAG